MLGIFTLSAHLSKTYLQLNIFQNLTFSDIRNLKNVSCKMQRKDPFPDQIRFILNTSCLFAFPFVAIYLYMAYVLCYIYFRDENTPWFLFINTTRAVQYLYIVFRSLAQQTSSHIRTCIDIRHLNHHLATTRRLPLLVLQRQNELYRIFLSPSQAMMMRSK